MNEWERQADMLWVTGEKVDRLLLVTGSETQRKFWQRRLGSGPMKDYAKGLGTVAIEGVPRGNLLGTLQALTGNDAPGGKLAENELGLVTMVLGMGQRMSPFTQALANMKASFPLPPFGGGGRDWHMVAELATRSTLPVAELLRTAGMSGAIVRWGDEVLLSGEALPRSLDPTPDVVRFVSRCTPTEVLAAQKEWLLVDSVTSAIEREIPRQSLSDLVGRLEQERTGNSRLETTVNLGSFAVSRDFLTAAAAELGEFVSDDTKRIDWDPYFWVGWHCRDEDGLKEEMRLEERAGLSGLREFRAKFPGFLTKVMAFRRNFEASLGRPARIVALEFGEPLWVDIGDHQSLGDLVTGLTEESPNGRALRRLFRFPAEPDSRGNYIQESSLAPGCDIENSIIAGATITEGAVLRNAVVFGGRYGRLEAPRGGACIFSAADSLTLAGPRSIAFRLKGSADLGEGDRRTTLFSPDGEIQMAWNESEGIIRGPLFTDPVLANPLPFGEAAELMGQVDPIELEKKWLEAISG